MKSPEQPVLHTPRELGIERLARRLRDRAADLIAVGIVVAFCLSFGNTLTQWWSTSSQTPAQEDASKGNVFSSEAATAPLNLGSNISFAFGDMPVAVTRSEIEGDLPAVWTAMTAACRERLVQGRPPAPENRPTSRSLPNEQRVLRQLATWTPHTVLEGHGNLFRLEGPLPTIVAARELESSPQLALWAMAIPALGENSWTMYLFEPTHAPIDGTESGPADRFPLPADARNILSVTDVTGTQLTAFSGNVHRADWPGRVNAALSQAGWKLDSEQRQIQDWTAKFQRVRQRHVEHCLVHVRINDFGEMRGFASLTSSPSTSSQRGEL